MRSVLLAIVMAGGWTSAGFAQAARIDDVAWLGGCWEMTAGARVTSEQWMAPGGKAMLGVSRTVQGNLLVEYEFIILREQGERLEYHAQPAGQPAASFLSRELTGTQVVFENAQHDFPQRIGYTRTGSDTLLAWIEGTAAGQARRREFPYRRISCTAR